MPEPKVLVSAKITATLDQQMRDAMKELGVSEEQFLRDAIRFYRSRCVHTQQREKSRARN